ncbi:hypothetical protein J3R30DRAFT_3702247 [Lentinula aciculospora]|uniref:Uncharacterized protein n=1 Tax=Lentinula aciculospora TaxID=153920 RepID=A0A9W9ABR8_9AGAR|nr:hypothetical protein J3R30DRAFT_3702247 [Lentinula aciculospora]
MIPLIPALALAFFSFLCSAFVVLRIVIPILPPHPLSRRVAPSEFGLPNFRSISAADQSHIWLASLDILALSIFVWEAISESTGGPTGYEVGQEALPSVRLWFILTVRQTCLLVVAGLTLLHIRLGRSVSFGKKHWMLWGPSSVLILTSTAVAAILSAAGLNSFFFGLVAYSSILAILSSAAFIGLAVTLLIIRKNLSSLNEDPESWPPMRHLEEKPRPSFATEEIDAMRDGASWITSNASSRRDSVSAWSFSTHHTVTTSRHSGRPQTTSHPSVPAKSSYWFGTSTSQVNAIPPVPPLPSPYGPLSPTSESLAEPDPFRRIPSPLPQHPRERFLGSQNSWLSSSNGSHTTLSAWSFPATQAESMHNASSPNLHTTLLPSSGAISSRPVTPALSSAQVLGGYGYNDSEKEASSTSLPGTALDVSLYRSLGWLILIWIPLGLSLPYLITISQNIPISLATSTLLTLSVTMSSPILALNILFRSPIPIPSGLFDAPNDLPTNLLRGATPTSDTVKWSHEYKRSASVTVVEGRRSGDVWLTNGDAADGKGKVSRALGMMSPMPKLSVLPLEENADEPITPPLPIQDGDSSMPVNLHSRSYSETSAQFGRIRKDSKASSYFSGADDSIAFASKIMIAQKHYSALAQTIQVNGSPEKGPSAGAHLFLDGPVASTSAVDIASSGNNRASQHLRTRSVTSVSGPQTPTSASFIASPSPPPAFPLPPTPPNVRAARLAKHKKSYSSISTGKFSFGPVDDMNEIDALTAGVLPLLVPGLQVGDDMKIRDSPPATWRRRAREELEITQERSRSRSTSRSRGEGKTARLLKALTEFGEDFSSPEMHSTPARTRAGALKAKQPRNRKTSTHKRNHFSLPSLGLGKDGVQSLGYWSNELGRAIESRFGQYTAVPSNVEFRRNTVFGGDSIPNDLSNLHATPEEIVNQINSRGAPLGRAMSTRSLGLRAEVPHGVDTARSSIMSMNNNVPPSAASTVTLFEDFVNGLESGPHAESTPHNNIAHKRVSEDVVPPLPSSGHYRTSTASNQFRDTTNKNRSSTNSNRRSSIVYIKSDKHATVTPPNAISTSSTTAMSSLAQWSSRAVRPLMPKSSKRQRKASEASPPARSTSMPESPRGGLRPLSLLQERDTNSVAGPRVQAASSKGTRPLALAKKEGATLSKKAKVMPSDENASPDVPRSRMNKHNLKPLNLARSDTNKMRAILRQDELLPDVVVRPPSTTEHQVYAYTFRN